MDDIEYAQRQLCSLSGMILSKARRDGSADRRCDHLAQRQAGWRAAAQLRQKIGWNGMIYGDGSKPCTPGEPQNSW